MLSCKVKYADHKFEINCFVCITVCPLGRHIRSAYRLSDSLLVLWTGFLTKFEMLNTNQRSFFRHTVHVHIPSCFSPVVPVPSSWSRRLGSVISIPSSRSRRVGPSVSVIWSRCRRPGAVVPVPSSRSRHPGPVILVPSFRSPVPQSWSRHPETCTSVKITSVIIIRL